MNMLRAIFGVLLLLAVGASGVKADARAIGPNLPNWLERTEVASGSFAPDSLPSVSLPAELDRVLRDYERLWKAGDADGLADIFTDDGFATQKGRWVRGRDAIIDAYGVAGGDLRLRAHTFATSGDVGYIVGAYGYNEGSPDRGKFILALRRSSDGKWLIAADLDSGIPQP